MSDDGSEERDMRMSASASATVRTRAASAGASLRQSEVPAAKAAEPAVNRFLEQLVESGSSLGRYAARHPRRTADAFCAIRMLPKVRAQVDVRSAEDQAVLTTLTFRKMSRRLFLGLTSVLEIPADGSTYTLGSSKQTLRRKARAATQAGVVWRKVDDREERARLVAIANEQEIANPRPEYRIDRPQNDDLIDVRLWLVGYSREGVPLLLSVTPVSGPWAALRYFRTLRDDGDASNARYLLTQVLVEHLAELGVQYLVDLARPHWLPNGLRHFQRMVGYRLIRIDVRARTTASATTT